MRGGLWVATHKDVRVIGASVYTFISLWKSEIDFNGSLLAYAPVLRMLWNESPILSPPIGKNFMFNKSEVLNVLRCLLLKIYARNPLSHMMNGMSIFPNRTCSLNTFR